jgi:hypothetical protein
MVCGGDLGAILTFKYKCFKNVLRWKIYDKIGFMQISPKDPAAKYHVV